MISLLWVALLAQSGAGGPASSPDIVLQNGHGANISALAFSPDGKFLVTASEDSTLKLWDPESGAELRTLRGHTNIVTSLALSNDGSRIASASLDHTLRVWDSATGESVAVFRGTQPTAYLLKITPDGNSLITAETVATGSILRIWDIKTGKQLRAIKRNDAAVSHIFFSNSNTLAVAEESGEDDATGALITYDLQTGRMLQTRQDVVCGVSDNGKWLALDRSNQKAREALIVDLPRDKPFAKLSGQVSRVMFSYNGSWLAYESVAGDTAIVRKTVGGPAYTIHGRSAEFSMVALSPDGRWLASAGADYSLHIWDVATGKLAHGITGQYTPTVLAFDSDGKRLAVNGGATDLASALQIWDVERRSLLPAPRVKHAISGLAFSKDGSYLAAASTGVEVYNARTTALVSRMECSSGSAFSPAFSPNNRLVAANCGGVITVWSVANGSESFHLGSASDANNGPIAFSPDGRFLAAATATGLLVYDTVARRMGPNVTTSDLVTALAFSVSGETLAFGTRMRAPSPDQKQPTLFLLDVRARRKIWAVNAGQWVSELKFARDGRAVLAADGEDLHKSGSLTLFDAASGKTLRHLPVRVPSSVMPALSPNAAWFGYGWNSGASLWRLSY